MTYPYSNDLITEQVSLKPTEGGFTITSSNSPRYGVGVVIDQSMLSQLLSEGVRCTMGDSKNTQHGTMLLG